MNVSICDDEKIYIESVREKVYVWAEQKGIPGTVNITSYTSSEDLLEAWNRGLHIDMLFIDLRIPNELTGLEIVKRIRAVDMNMPIAFISNYPDHACDGYTVNALRYILKPIRQQQVSECMDIAYTRWIYQKSDCLKLEVNKQAIFLPFRDIIYLEALGHTIRFYTTDTRSTSVRGTLSDYEKRMPSLFVKAHRSYIVNIMYVRRISRESLTLAGGTTLPLSHSCAESVNAAFRQYNFGET